MRSFALRSAALAFAVALCAQPAAAQRDRHDDSEARVVSRQPLRSASSAIETRNGEVALLLVDRNLVIQLTDRGLNKVDRDMDDDAQKESGFARLVSGIVRSGVRSLLDHGIEYPVSELRDARYENGRIVLINREGEQIFKDVQVNDMQVMESFSPAAARAFVARVNQARRRRAEL